MFLPTIVFSKEKATYFGTLEDIKFGADTKLGVFKSF
jgi:hypothetical protein